MRNRKQEKERCMLATEVNRNRSACRMLAWALESIEANPPQTEVQRMEVFEGMTYVLETMVGSLGDICRKLSPD
jgi:hypothetical protein